MLVKGVRSILYWYSQKQPSRGVLRKRCSENMQQIYRRKPMGKCYFNKVAKQSNFIEITLRHRCSPVNLMHIFRTLFHKNTYGWLLLYFSRILIIQSAWYSAEQLFWRISIFVEHLLQWLLLLIHWIPMINTYFFLAFNL